MTQDKITYDYEATFKELKKSSQASLTMVILGALALIVSLVYSGTRLAPLEEEIHKKSSELEKLAQTEQDYLKKIDIAKNQYEQLRTNIEKLYAVKVTPNNYVYELKATAKAISHSNGQPIYTFTIIVNAPSSTLDTIRRVEYLFDHPTFRQKSQISEDSSNQFMVKYNGWGCLTRVTATLELKDGESQKIDFNMCQSLGPQWSDEGMDKDAPIEKSGPSKLPQKMPQKFPEKRLPQLEEINKLIKF
jgi:hypothetical protein